MTTSYILNQLDFIQRLIDIHDLKQCHEIHLPILDRDNDTLCLYIEKLSHQQYLVSDDSYTLNMLQDTGKLIERNHICYLCDQEGVCLKDNELFVISNEEELMQKVLNLIKIILLCNN